MKGKQMRVLLDYNKNYYKANMHCHSTYSDGKMTVKELKEAYKKEGYQIIAFTDHEHLIDNSSLNDKDFLAITACEIAIKEYPDCSTLVRQDMKVCHLNFYALDPHNINTPCYNSVYDHFITESAKDKIIIPKEDFKREYSKEGINAIIKEATDKGFLVSYNHPRWSLENARDYLNYKGLWAVEIFNTSCWREGYFEYNVNTYDDFLRDGEKIACVAGDDNHNRKQDSFGGYVMINSPDLEYSNIMTALKEHNFYVSTGARINGLFIEGNVAHLSVPGAKKVIMTTGVRKTVVKDLECEENLNDITFELSEHYKYVRFDVFDSDNRFASTCAYFI